MSIPEPLPDAPPGLPSGAETIALQTRDGLTLRAMVLGGDIPAKGTIIVLQGRTEFLEKYHETFSRLNMRGFTILAFDWRGQGGSERQLRDPRKGHVEDFEDFRIDLDAVFECARTRNLPHPWSLLAHSMGGCVALDALDRGAAPVERAVLLSPMARFRSGPFPGAARLIARVLSSFGLSRRTLPGAHREDNVLSADFEKNSLTGDPARYALLKAQTAAFREHTIGAPTIGWIDAAFDATARFEHPDFGATNSIPTLILTAGADEVVDSTVAEALAARMRGTHAMRIPGARHEMLQETDAIQAQLWAAFDAFIPGTRLARQANHAA